MKSEAVPTSRLIKKKRTELCLSGCALAQITCSILIKGAKVRFYAKGNSMSPFIMDGDIITLSPIRFRKLKFGDVVAFINSKSGKLIVHRVVAKRGDGYLLKGDNVNEPDGEIINDDIIGYVEKIERNTKASLFGLRAERIIIAVGSRINLWQRRIINYLIRLMKNPFHD